MARSCRSPANTRTSWSDFVRDRCGRELARSLQELFGCGRTHDAIALSEKEGDVRIGTRLLVDRCCGLLQSTFGAADECCQFRVVKEDVESVVHKKASAILPTRLWSRRVRS